MNLSISRDGVEIGEWMDEDVRVLYSEGQLLPTDYYWTEGMAEWKELRTLIKPPPPQSAVVPFAGNHKSRKSRPSVTKIFVLLVGITAFIAIIIAGFLYTAIIAGFLYTAPVATDIHLPDLSKVVGTPLNNVDHAAPAPTIADATDVTKVKEGTLGFDNTVKIGPAFEGCSFLKNVAWKSFSTAQGRTIVEATAAVDI